MLQERIEPALRSFFHADPRGVVAAYLLPVPRTSEGVVPTDGITLAVQYAEPFDPSFSALPLDLEQELEALLACPVHLLLLNTMSKANQRRTLNASTPLIDGHATQYA